MPASGVELDAQVGRVLVLRVFFFFALQPSWWRYEGV